MRLSLFDLVINYLSADTTHSDSREVMYTVSQSSLDVLLAHCPKCGSPVVSQEDCVVGAMLVSKLTCERGCDVTLRSHSTTGANKQSLCKFRVGSYVGDCYQLEETCLRVV